MRDISEVSQASGIPASALRYYEELGLIQSAGRKGLRRQYAPAVLSRLALISLGQQAGFSLQEIAAMLGDDGQIAREPLHEKIAELDQQIRQLKAVRDALSHAAVCPHPQHLDCPKFQQLLQIAQKRKQRKLRGGRNAEPR